MKAQMAALNARITTLEVSQQSGHDAISSFADRLVEENAKIDQRLADLQNATGVHLNTIEDTFKRCNQAMEELKVASQAASSAAAHALASSSGASSSSDLSYLP